MSFIFFVKDVVKMPYESNSQDNPAHEKRVEQLLIKHNIKYVYQPKGTHRFPDFDLPDLNLNLECKSVNKGIKPVWNRGLPRPGSLYIISSKKLGRTTIFFGEDVLPEETYDRLMAVDQKYKTIINEVNDKHDDGWINYPRLAFDNRGKNAPNYWDRTFVDNVVSRVEEI
jgi:hypothetical protein